IGSENLISSWAKAFEPSGIAIAQLWLTHANWDHKGEVKSIKDTLLEALANGVVPIINENDVVSDAEIMLMLKGWGENDNMAARVASLVGASAVLFLSTVGWIYEANPKEHKTARKYEVIDAHTIPVTLLLPNGTSPHGDGKNGINSIKTKVDAAAFCFRFGARASIANLFAGPDVIVSFGLATKEYGTRMGTETRFIE
ncbi:MAG: hypothetical protein NUV54_03615, partial [Candidatus Taylorbacteria bacterium]|nr:hypothetical protein [Candidatus Taylorbacteria bacterium]